MLGREELESQRIIAYGGDDEMYEKEEADKVMDAMEARIKELEKALDNAITGGEIALEQARKLEKALNNAIKTTAEK